MGVSRCLTIMIPNSKLSTPSYACTEISVGEAYRWVGPNFIIHHFLHDRALILTDDTTPILANLPSWTSERRQPQTGCEGKRKNIHRSTQHNILC